ncbi:hypothetical protein AYO20_10518 [Fonsecaea nubica]|uniref:Uncharacterized protein n=1 Tax=Fonsecaea nubica TaxID=856822 RepID=A0A178C6D3_9EURO|nr:hypothetical protein AYO20_10518 [Fonsecaea nubica]OAL24984.1 hypothetical protein AYO20_10518 [Fonsecaea nubica]
MAESPSGGRHRRHSHEAGSPVNCPSGCGLRHEPGTDLNQASCDCEEGYYDREQRVFYTGSDVRDKKSPETRQEYLERIEGTHADPKKNNQGDYFLPGDGIRYEVLRSLKDDIFGERAQIWEHELSGQRGWLIRADRRRNYSWPTIIGRLQQQSQSQDTPDRVRRPPDPRPAISAAGSSGTRPTSGYTAPLTTIRYGTPSYSSQSATGSSYAQVTQTSDLSGVGSGFPGSPQVNLYAPSITPQSSAPSSETRSYAISRQSTAQPGKDVHVPNYIPTSRRPREAQPLTTEASDGRPERTSQYSQSSNIRSGVPRAMTDSADESTSRRGGSEITSTLPTRQKGTTADEKQKRKNRKG